MKRQNVQSSFYFLKAARQTQTCHLIHVLVGGLKGKMANMPRARVFTLQTKALLSAALFYITTCVISSARDTCPRAFVSTQSSFEPLFFVCV